MEIAPVSGYDINGFLSSLTDPFGAYLPVNTNASGQVTSLNDLAGHDCELSLAK